jgi:hypothetical protein
MGCNRIRKNSRVKWLVPPKKINGRRNHLGVSFQYPSTSYGKKD